MKGEQEHNINHVRIIYIFCSKLELEKTSKGRLETQVARLKEVIDFNKALSYITTFIQYLAVVNQ